MKFFRVFYVALLILSLFFVTSYTYRGHKEAEKVKGAATENPDAKIQGIILPHHDLARELIIRSLEKISSNGGYSTIVVFGPNHYYPHETSFITTTDIPGISLDEDFIQNMIKDTRMVNNGNVLRKEHSFNIPVKYLANFFPGAKFIPIVVPQNYDRERLKEIAGYLSDRLDPGNSLFVASTDFSHENMLLEAERRNKESVDAIKNFDYEKIYAFNSENLDSPGSVGLLLHVMEKRESRNFKLLFDSHGAFVEDNPGLQGTSYIIGTFR